MGENRSIDRLGMRARPAGSPVMHQRWENLLFLHWPVDPKALRPLIPAPLEIDTFDGQAWVGITPFHLTDLHPVALPAFPGLSSFHELNLRTYVLHEDKPGLWFFSLDASKLIPAMAARLFFMLPYFHARMRFTQQGKDCSFSMRRTGPPASAFKACWQIGDRLRDPDKDSLAFFLVERYCAYTVEAAGVYQIRIYHHPWILEDATVQLEHSSLFSSLGLNEPAVDPLPHFAHSMDVEVWPPAQVSRQTILKQRIKVPVE